MLGDRPIAKREVEVVKVGPAGFATASSLSDVRSRSPFRACIVVALQPGSLIPSKSRVRLGDSPIQLISLGQISLDAKEDGGWV